MHLMERRGSGLREICFATAAEASYSPECKPTFESENGVFRVILADMKNAQSMTTDPVSKSILLMLGNLKNGEKSAIELMVSLSLSHRPSFRDNYIAPALEANLIERTIPEKPNSRNQKYRLTEAGRKLLNSK